MRERHGVLGTPEEERLLKQGQCPACGSRTFVGGPQGGLSTNAGCAECGSWWNLAVIDGEVWVHGAISPPPSGTRRTAPGPLLEVTRPAPPPLPPDPKCPWCNGRARAPAEVFTQTVSRPLQIVDCILSLRPAPEGMTSLANRTGSPPRLEVRAAEPVYVTWSRDGHTHYTIGYYVSRNRARLTLARTKTMVDGELVPYDFFTIPRRYVVKVFRG